MTSSSDKNEQTNLSRRKLLKGAFTGAGVAALSVAGATAAAPLQTTAYANASSKTQIDAGEFDAVVVGGGMSGLAAALELKKAGKRVLILEARNRVGGRVMTFYSPGRYRHIPVDGGAEFIGDPQTHMMALAERYGVELEETPNTGDNIYYRRKRATRFAAEGLLGAIPVDFGILQVGIAQEIVKAELDKFPVGKPWLHPNAKKLDRLTFDEWINRHVFVESGKFLLQLLCSSTLSVHPSEVSALFMFNYIAAAGNEDIKGNPDILINVKTKVDGKEMGGAQQYLTKGGSQQYAWAMLYELFTGETSKPWGAFYWDDQVLPNFETDSSELYEMNGQAIQLNSPVSAINTNPDTGLIEIQSENLDITTEHVIIAMSPAVASNISFNPTLPSGKMQMQDRMPMGSICKVMVYYDRPFWRDRGLTGQVISDLSGNAGPVDVVYDNSPSPSFLQPNPPGILIGFISADAMREIDNLSKDADKEKDDNSTFYLEVRRQAIQSMVTYFGYRASEAYVRDFAFNRWDDELYSRGGPTGVTGTGVISSYWEKHLRTPTGNIHWAGTETADYWCGYMEGAVRSGKRAAKEIL